MARGAGGGTDSVPTLIREATPLEQLRQLQTCELVALVGVEDVRRGHLVGAIDPQVAQQVRINRMVPAGMGLPVQRRLGLEDG